MTLDAFENKRGVWQDYTAQLWMIDPLQAAASMHVFVHHDFRQLAYRGAWNLGCEHAFCHIALGEHSGPFLYHRINFSYVLDTRTARGKSRIVFEIDATHDAED